MALIKSVRGFTPTFGSNCYLSENATVVGEVEVGNDCSIWFNAVLRGDVNSIKVGNKVNIQDGAVLHCLYERSKVIIGNNVSIGHNVIIHGATVQDNVLIGMGAIVMDNVVVGENSIIAAGSVVLDSTLIEPGSLYAGVPAIFVKKVNQEQGNEMITKIANNYLMYAGWFKE